MKAVVIGGSLGGLFAANLLIRAGWDVHVYEHSRDDLIGRGAGIITHQDLFDCLGAVGVVFDESFGVDIPRRIAFDQSGTVVDTLTVPQCLTTWGKLYSLLKAAFPHDRYHYGHTLVRIDHDAARVTAAFTNGATAHGDLLVAADGIRSTARAQLAKEVRPHYAGYVAWRGLADETALSRESHDALFPNFAFSLAPREHMLGYPVAGFTRSTKPGERCYNFVWYRPVADLETLCTDVNGRRHDMSVPPPLLDPRMVEHVRDDAERLLAPQFGEVVRKAPQPFFQAIFDVESTRMAFDRVALLGDAAFVARPHCGMGVSKAAGDAMTLVSALRSTANDVQAALAQYNDARVPFGAEVVRHAQKLGAYLGGDDSDEARCHHTPRAVMREIAVPWESREKFL